MRASCAVRACTCASWAAELMRASCTLLKSLFCREADDVMDHARRLGLSEREAELELILAGGDWEQVGAPAGLARHGNASHTAGPRLQQILHLQRSPFRWGASSPSMPILPWCSSLPLQAKQQLTVRAEFGDRFDTADSSPHSAAAGQAAPAVVRGQRVAHLLSAA